MLPVKLIAPLPKHGEPGYFGTKRKYDIHTGIDFIHQRRRGSFCSPRWD